MMEAYEYTIMKALLKRLYRKELISAEAYSQTVNQLDLELENSIAPSYDTNDRKGACNHGIVSN